MMEYVMKKITMRLAVLMVEIVVTFMPFGTLGVRVSVLTVHARSHVMMKQAGVKIIHSGIVMKIVPSLMVKRHVGLRANELATNVLPKPAQTLEILSSFLTYAKK